MPAPGEEGRFQARPYFPQADWLWSPVPASPVLDVDSAAWVTDLAADAHQCALIEFGATLRGPGGPSGDPVDASTPRYDVVFRQANGGGGSDWGEDPFTLDMPWPADLVVPGVISPGVTPSGSPPYNGDVVVADPTTGQVFCLWRAYDNGATKNAWWGRQASLYGDGREPGTDHEGASTGSRLSRYATVIRAAEMTAAAAAGYVAIPRALAFFTDMAAPEVRYPASIGDGDNAALVALPIPEGARVQLDPSIDVDAIVGITDWERIIAKTLQTYGAYCMGNGGVRMGFQFEYLGEGSPETDPYTDVDAGIYDYFDMVNIPWGDLRVLANWDGS